MRFPLLILATAASLAAPLCAGPPDVDDAPANPPSASRIAPEEEPGERIEIAGTLRGADGKPVPGAVVYAYQTGADGEYHMKDERPRLRGWARTDDAGRFTFLTTMPGGYPGGRAPVHVHVHVWGGGYPRQWFELLFEGDERLASLPKVPEFFQVMPREGRRFTANLALRRTSNFR